MEEPKGRKKWEGHTVFQTRHKDRKHELTAAVRTVLGLVLCKTGPASWGGRDHGALPFTAELLATSRFWEGRRYCLELCAQG